MNLSRKTISMLFLLLVILISLIFSHLLRSNVEGFSQDGSPSQASASSPAPTPAPSPAPAPAPTPAPSPAPSPEKESFITMLPETDVNQCTTFVQESKRKISKKFDASDVYKHTFGISENETFSPIRI